MAILGRDFAEIGHTPHARVAELADAPDLGSGSASTRSLGGENHASPSPSSPPIGEVWNWVRNTARALGVPVFKAKLVDAEAFRRAVEATQAANDAVQLDGPDRVLAAVGRKRAG